MSFDPVSYLCTVSNFTTNSTTILEDDFDSPAVPAVASSENALLNDAAAASAALRAALPPGAVDEADDSSA